MLQAPHVRQMLISPVLPRLAVVLAFNWDWLTAVGAAPLILSLSALLLPCALWGFAARTESSGLRQKRCRWKTRNAATGTENSIPNYQRVKPPSLRGLLGPAEHPVESQYHDLEYPAATVETAIGHCGPGADCYCRASLLGLAVLRPRTKNHAGQTVYQR